MDISDLIDDLSAGVARDPDTLAWADLTYGQDHRVYVNFDVENPPGSDYCPYVMLMPERKRAGQTIRERTHVVERIDDGVAGDEDGRGGRALPQEVFAGAGRGREVEVGDDAGDAAVDLLGERLPRLV